MTVGERTLVGDGVFVPAEKRRIGMVFQDAAVFPHLSVARNVAYGLPRRDPGRDARVAETLALVGLEGLRRSRAGHPLGRPGCSASRWRARWRRAPR